MRLNLRNYKLKRTPCNAPRDEQSAAPKRYPNVGEKFDYCKMAENVFGEVSENMSSESENSEVSEVVDDDTFTEF